MVSVRERRRADGTRSFAVLWRDPETGLLTGVGADTPVAGRTRRRSLKHLIAKNRFPARFGLEVEVEEVDLDTTAVTVRGERLTGDRAEAIAREVLDRSEAS